MTQLQQGDKLVGASFDIDGEVLRVPLGVFGMIAPFNFPLMVPFWFFPYALATGNTYVVKPSEQVPLSMNRVAEFVDEVGFPPGMKIHQTEIFGPVVVILKAGSLDEAIQIINNHPYGNGASIYTQNGYCARKFKPETKAGMIGINVGIPAPMAPLPFGGLKASLLADTKAQGKAVIHFFTDQKVISERYWPEA